MQNANQFAFSPESQQHRKSLGKWQTCRLADCDRMKAWMLKPERAPPRFPYDDGCLPHPFSDHKEDFGAWHTAGDPRQPRRVSDLGWWTFPDLNRRP